MTGHAPRFSIVTAVYNVEPYLPEFIASIEALRVDADDLEIVAVDDGSTDGSLDVLHGWAGRSRYRVNVVTKANGGQGSARNLGLTLATGEWVTFPDPDDLLDQNYLAAAARFAANHPDVEVMSARPILLHDGTGQRSATHPRQWQYRQGDRVADLTQQPNVFLGVSAGSFFTRARIEALGLRFDDAVRPNFEDAHFAVRFLLDLPVPLMGLLGSATYIYRKRAAGTSTLQRSLRDQGRYTNVLEFGYLGVIADARSRLGRVPAWLQHLLIYELSWYLAEDDKISSNAYLAPDVVPRFHALLQKILVELEPEVVAAHRVRKLRSVWVDVFAHGGRDAPWHAAYAVRTRTDAVAGLQRINYRFGGTVPGESFEINGRAVNPVAAKSMAHRYYGADLLFERILWLPLGDELQIRLGNVVVPILDRWPRPAWRRARPGLARRIWAYRRLPITRLAHATRRAAGRTRRRLRGRTLRALSRLWPWRSRFADAWLLMDRIHDADDNGERLFEHLRRERPEINAWFVIERGSPDWHRLRARGEDRLLAHGSLVWRLAMLNASWLLSSHADLPIMRPPQLARTGPSTRRFAFLQHGVIKDDLSRWLNQRTIDLFVVSTRDELASVANDGSPYAVTHRETRNTGLPRFDRLLAVGGAVPLAERNLVIVAPTWRQWLTLPVARGSQRRTIDHAFWDSEYVRNWTGFLRSEAVADALARRGWTLGFMPHPNLQGALDAFDLPAHIQRLAFVGVDVQALYGRCALLVTDYSSVAFNMAYLDRPVVYFQFDHDAMAHGAHVGRAGYFDYRRDGFGPVVEDLDAAVQATIESIERGPFPSPLYQARIDQTFVQRDGGASARVVAAVEELSRPSGSRAS